MLAGGLPVAAAGSSAPGAAGPGEAGLAEKWRRASKILVVRDGRINEGSDLVRSTYRRQVVFVHNDGGDGPRFFAVGKTGRTKAVFRLRGAPARDWEDAAVGPRHTLWFGDIGDNGRSRRTVAVVRTREPRAMRSGVRTYTAFRLNYPDGAHNAEALLVHPRTGRVFVATKRSSGGYLYRAPRRLRAGRVNQLTRVRRVPANITAGDFSPRRGRYILRKYDTAWIYGRTGRRLVTIDLPSQRLGESITFNRRGSAVLLHSEGVRQPIWRIR